MSAAFPVGRYRNGKRDDDHKPENVLAQHEGDDTPWLLTDFGAGRFLPRGQVAHSVSGSLGYLAPEVLVHGATPLSDQYSLGIMGLELLLGRLPRPAEIPELLLPLHRAVGLPAVIARLASAVPAQRFPNMIQAVTDLKQAVADMRQEQNIAEFLRPHLIAQLGLSPAATDELIAAWDKKDSFLDFLVLRGLIDRARARTILAIYKGYLDLPMENVFARSASLGLLWTASGEPHALAESQEKPPEPPPELPPMPPAATFTAAAAHAPDPKAAPLIVAPETSPTGNHGNAAPSEKEPAPILPALAKPLPSDPSPAKPPRAPLMREQITVGMRMGRYLLQELLGEGATATVFRSFHEMLNIPVAIKVFERIDASSDPEAAQRFLTEAQTLVRLEHPNIVRILDVDLYEQLPYIVMEYVGEMTLLAQIQNLGQLPAARIAQIGIAVAEALDAATRLGLLHRDIKPSNILERKDGHIKLVDFGIATSRNKEGLLNDPLAQRGLVSGTPSYIAPEQVQNPGAIDLRSDMYGLGATLYHAAVGRPPFVRASVEETLKAHIYDEPVHITQLIPGFAVHLAWTIHRLLKKRPEDRFASWVQVKDALASTLIDEPEVSIVESPRRSDVAETEDWPPAARALPARGPTAAVANAAQAPLDAGISAPAPKAAMVLPPRGAVIPVREPKMAAEFALLQAALRRSFLYQTWVALEPRMRLAMTLAFGLFVTLLLFVIYR